jgi:type IV pilus assembly protein PilC
MPSFQYEARSRTGEVKKGVLEANDVGAANDALRRQGLTPTDIKAKAREINLKLPGFGGGVSGKELATFTRQFATMIDAGLPLVQCLEILGSQEPNKFFAKAIAKIRSDVESGSTFADALKKHPKVFDKLYCNMVEAGEMGGILDTILARLANYIEKAMKLKRRIKSAMTYPAVIISVAAFVVAGLLIFIIPIFAQLFSDFGQQLPLPTRICIWASDFLKKYFFVLIPVIGISIWGSIKAYKQSPMVRKRIDQLLLRMPIIGMLVRKTAVAKFTRTLGTLISSGVPILEGLDIVAKTAGNVVVEEALVFTRQAISEGKTISEPLMKTGVFPSMVIQMISVGEAAGALDSMLSKIADFYDDEVDVAVGSLTSLMEPLLMVFLGVICGFVVIAMYLPIFKLASVVSG